MIIGRDSPLTDDLALLFQRHQAEMHADTPPESVHMMPRADLVHADIAFYVLRDGDRPLGMGAVKTFAPGEGEVKSMHVLSEARGRGLSRRLLDYMIADARASGLTRLSLETGSQASFAPARGLYANAGFTECPPFGRYEPDPNSVFMTRAI